MNDGRAGPLSEMGRQAMCEGKEPFSSANIAMRVVRRRNRKDKFGQSEVYRCPYCNQWHIGQGRKSTRKERLRRLTATS